MSNRAWVTLATNDSYGLGALVLAHSLRQVGSQYPAVVLITPSVTDAMRERLRAVFAEVVIVDVLDSRDATHLALLQRPELGITFTKIHCWNLTQYEKCVFLDADTLVVQNCDELFEREELSAAPDVGWPDCFNSGVFVFSPSAGTFTRLVAFAQERGSFDGGDQGLLNSFFSDWARGDINKHLPFLYNVTSAAFYSYLPALKHYGQDLKIIHFIGAAKPWLQHFNFESRTVDAPEHIKGLLQLWWDIFTSQVHTQLETSMSGVAGNLARVVPGTSSHEALDDLTRRQGWEAGNIDYMGADSFDKIWAKISQTLNEPRVSPPKEPSPPKQPEPQPAQAEAPKESEVVEVTQEAVPVEVPPAAALGPTPVEAQEPTQPPAPEVTSVSEQPPAPEPIKVETQASEQTSAPELVKVETQGSDQPPAPELAKVETPVSEQPPAPEPVKVETPVSEQPPAPEPVKVETPVTDLQKAPTPEQPPAALQPLKVIEPVTAPTSVETVTAAAPSVETPVVAPAAAVKPEPVKVPEPVASEQPVSDKPTEASAAVPLTEQPVDKPIEPVVEPKKTETEQKPETPVTEQKESAVQALKASEQVQAAPTSPTKAEEAPVKTAATPEATKVPAVTDSPPLANTPSKEEAPAIPAAKSEERRKPAGKLQLAAPGVADPLPTPDSELEDAATLAHAIIASELRTPTVTGAPDSPAVPTSPPAPKEPRKLSVEEPQVPTPPVGAVSLAQIGVKPKDKTTTAEQIESSIVAAATPATPSSPPAPAADAPKKKVVKKAAKKETAAAASGDVPAPVPPPRKKEKKPKEK